MKPDFITNGFDVVGTDEEPVLYVVAKNDDREYHWNCKLSNLKEHPNKFDGYKLETITLLGTLKTRRHAEALIDFLRITGLCLMKKSDYEK